MTSKVFAQCCKVLHNAAMHTTPKTLRVSVPVTPEVLEKFQRFSEVSGLSVGKSMGDWLKDTMGGLDAMIEILESHKRSPARAMEKLSTYATALQDMTGEALELMKTGPSPLGEGDPPAGKARQVAREAMAKAAQSPRLVIRGVKSSDKGEKGGKRS